MKSFSLLNQSIFDIFLGFSLLFFIIPVSNACLARFNIPNPSKPELYGSIFIAKVESFKLVPSIFSHSDLTPPYKVVLSKPIDILYGEEQSSTVVHTSAGCGLPIPQVGKVGIFFVHSEGRKEIEVLFYDDLGGYNLVTTVKKVREAIKNGI